MSLADATDQITGANLVLGKVTEAFDEKVPDGQVVATDPKAGTSLKRGTVVALTVSKGRQPIPVEDFTGKPLDAARAALGKAGLAVEVTAEENNDTVPAGSIIRQDPAGRHPVQGGQGLRRRLQGSGPRRRARRPHRPAGDRGQGDPRGRRLQGHERPGASPASTSAPWARWTPARGRWCPRAPTITLTTV